MVVRGEPTGEEKEAGEEDLGECQMLPFSEIKVIARDGGVLTPFSILRIASGKKFKC